MSILPPQSRCNDDAETGMRETAAQLVAFGWLLAPFTVQQTPVQEHPPEVRTQCAGGSAACAWKRIPPIGRPPLQGQRHRGIQKRD